jgi:hypothetical protein
LLAAFQLTLFVLVCDVYILIINVYSTQHLEILNASFFMSLHYTMSIVIKLIDTFTKLFFCFRIMNSMYLCVASLL